MRRARRENRDVQAAVHQLFFQVVGEIFDQIQAKIRQVVLDGRQQQRGQERADRRRHAERTGANERPLVVGGNHFQRIDLMQDVSRLRHDLVADFRQPDMPFRAFEYPHAKAILEFLQLPAQRRLADVAPRRGPAKMKLLGDGD